MKKILVAAQKGGVGKTTITTNLATRLPGVSAIVDLDPQASAFEWSDLRRRNGISETPAAIRSSISELERWISVAESNGTEFCVIDSVGTSNTVIIEAARLADLILIPTLVNAPDIAAIRTTLRLLAGTMAPRVVVLNRVDTLFGFQRRETRATDAIKHFGGTLADARLSSLLEFPEAIAVGQAAHEYAPRGKGGKQIAQLAEVAVTYLKVT